MDYQLVALVLWTAFYAALLIVGIGILAARHGHRGAAIALLVLGATILIAFSAIAGFSIGRLTILLPVLVAGYLTAMGRERTAVATNLVGATMVYLTCSWFLTPYLPTSPLDFVFAFWGAPIYLALLVAAASWSILGPGRNSRRGQASATG